MLCGEHRAKDGAGIEVGLTGALSSRPEETVAQHMQQCPGRMPDRHDGKHSRPSLSTLASIHDRFFGAKSDGSARVEVVEREAATQRLVVQSRVSSVLVCGVEVVERGAAIQRLADTLFSFQ